MRQFFITFPNCHTLRSELSWTQYRMLMRVENETARNFYLEECSKSGWSNRQLERQIGSFYYEGLLSSKGKETVRNEVIALELAKTPEDIIHDPYILEFIGLEERDTFLEKELKQAPIDKFQKLLL